MGIVQFVPNNSQMRNPQLLRVGQCELHYDKRSRTLTIEKLNITMATKISDVAVSKDKLLEAGYRCGDLIGRLVEVLDFDSVMGEQGNYVVCNIKVDGVQSEKKLVTGAQNIVARLNEAAHLNLLPVEGKIIKIGNAYDMV